MHCTGAGHVDAVQNIHVVTAHMHEVRVHMHMYTISCAPHARSCRLDLRSGDISTDSYIEDIFDSRCRCVADMLYAAGRLRTSSKQLCVANAQRAGRRLCASCKYAHDALTYG